MMPTTSATPPILIDAHRTQEASILTLTGLLDGSTYRGLRDEIIKAALDQPRAVIVDVNGLCVPSDSAWSVFTSARWHVSTWPDVPILLVCNRPRARRKIAQLNVARYVPVHSTCAAALAAACDRSLHGRHRARAQLPGDVASIRLARGLIASWLEVWDQTGLIPVAGTVATVFVENVLMHTECAPVLRVESYRDTVTVAVQDRSHRPANRVEDPRLGTTVVSGLSVVSALARAWGSTPTLTGKTMWALVGAENGL